MKFGIAAKLSLLLAIVGVLSAGLTGFYSYEASRKILIRSAKNELSNSADALLRRIGLSRAEIARNLQLIAEHSAAVDALLADQTLSQATGTKEKDNETLTKSKSGSDAIAELFRLLMLANPDYAQMRLIAFKDHGLERVRVDRDGEHLLRVVGDELQEKGHLPYVYETRRLAPHAIYLSRFAVNRERGAHSGFGKPAVQMATPVFNAQQAAIGVVVINVDMNSGFAQLASSVPEDYRLYLANGNGDYLIHPNPDKAFGFDRGRPVLVQNEFPATQALIDGDSDRTLFEALDGDHASPLVAAFVARRIEAASPENALIVGLSQPLTSVLGEADRLSETTLRIVLGLCLVCILLAVIVARAVSRPINSMSNVAKRFAYGQRAAGLPLEREDEIGVLARSFLHMQNQINAQMDELRQSRQDLEHLARHDSLTGLPNRILFEEHMEHALAARRREISQLALLFVDIDRFKPINDMLGHAIGDLLLKEIADRIRLAVRGSDIPARIGGDEFVVLLPVIGQREDALTVAEKIRLSIMKPFVTEGHHLAVSASIGIAIFPEDGNELIDLAKHADKAMYVAKEQGRNAVLFYSQNLDTAADKEEIPPDTGGRWQPS